jgi:hypothetical protein
MLQGHEQVVLAALMNGSESLPVSDEDFLPPNRTIFRRIRSLDNRSLIAVTDALRKAGELERVGGAGRITEIALMPHDDASVEYALNEVLDASRQRKAANIGGELRRGNMSPERAQQELSSLNSFRTSGRNGKDQVIDDFPEPLDDVAFYGLAGDIVRKIEPHTEASPVALLVQILVAFGSVIGRSAYIVADGARHAMNLFVVLAGETSKSRKGTSWQHVLRLFERAAQEWRQNCIVHGLSSGEGLIWRVRDSISATVKNKKTGKYEEEIVDAGVTDKRLCVVEGEFANVLKVMAREGNTLSSVIRNAWDDGNLTSLTKNSPARATGAHLSIIGHITKHESRRLLTETESANGFGNRFLWPAVRRSKCLPEGGSIDKENLNDLVMGLHDAIEFGRNAGEVTRSDEARELWRIVYPELSEGAPGLLGAITARAEAQVLRLSAIYALLDRSTKIEAEHHRAALALWNYCDRSAKWIFSTTTGDNRADRILFALQVAGKTGLTKTKISERVFNRNVSSGALSDALRILQQSGRATFNKETTGGAPRARWFANSAS